MKVPLLLAASALASVAVLGGLTAWRDAHPGDRERELSWIESYVAWTREIDDALSDGEDAPAVGCERHLLALAGRAPTARTTAAMEAALAGCRQLRRSIVEAEAEVALPDALVDDWYNTRDRVLSKLMDEHRSPEASEAEVECVALQHVRDLVAGAGRPASYEELMVGLAWDVGYAANLPEYKTETCRNGGPLDVRPHSDVWP